MTRFWKALSLFAAVVAGWSARGAGDLFDQLGMSKQQAAENAVWSFSVGQVPVSEARNVVRPASAAARAVMVEQALTWAKAYTATPQFAAEYEKYRQEQKPDDSDAEAMQQWKEDFPAGAKAIVAKRLREFLEASRNVDYDAKLVRSGRMMTFANEEYESQSSEWKICFRAGREPVERARAIATTWLAELQKK